MNDFRPPEAYRLVNRSEIPEIGLTGTVLEHEKSGARVICLPSEDDNKSFFIAFRTPPVDDTGLPQILEHSVLCGSDKYPIKDPFMELAKSSLNTFLNAMTYPDKTIYPVASCNEKDFANLMDVYMDAVLHPLIHSRPQIFRQEGWRYELSDPDGELTLNGVVYSEMKGVYSDPEELLSECSVSSLFPDTAYRFESGGDPVHIPELSYEDFCRFHKRLYHPSNSYIFLYGNVDMEERLRFLDQAYLAGYERIETDSAIALQQPFEERRELSLTYPVSEEEDAEDRSYYSLQWAVGDIEDTRLMNAFDVLETVLLAAPGAPLKQALLDAGLAGDVSGGFLAYLRQPLFTVVARDGADDKREAFRDLVLETLEKLANEGLNPRSLEAAISSREFQRREADFGGLSKGLIYGLGILDSWLYDGTDPFRHLRFEADFAFLREHLSDGYFEGLIRRYLLNNPHASLVEMKPEPGKAEKDAEALRQKLKAYKDSLSEEEIGALIEQNKALKAYQEEAESAEVRRCVPHLTKADLRRTIRPFENREQPLGPARLIWRPAQTAGIVYADLLFPLENVPPRLYPYLGLLKACFAAVSTEKRDYRTLYDDLQSDLGGWSMDVSVLQPLQGEWQPFASVSFKALAVRWEAALRLIREICLESLFDDEKRLQEIVSSLVIGQRQLFLQAGHAAARSRASSYFSGAACFMEQIQGLDHFRFTSGLLQQFEEKKEELKAALQELSRLVFTGDGLILNLTCGEEAFPALTGPLGALAADLPSDPARRFEKPVPRKKNEGIMTTGSVGYVAQCGSFAKAGPYTGALRVLNSLLSTEYLWQKLRVLGGAYGAMCSFGVTGSSFFASYRDPNIRSTKAAYQGVPAYLRELELPEETLENFIISTVGGMDFPYTPSVQGSMDFRNYLCGVTAEFLQKERDEVIGCTAKDLKALAPYVEEILKADCFCTFGSSVKIEEEKDLFLTTENL